ncbi:hypothetical protein N0Y54_43340 [Nostoc punctiforme UO1]|uniref:hypothetical protein n=1 Tax=Nostoc punctiforme TaxID=272131 RepID=UPI0030AC0029
MLIFSTTLGIAAPEAIAYSGGALISKLISELAQVRRWRNRLPSRCNGHLIWPCLAAADLRQHQVFVVKAVP